MLPPALFSVPSQTPEEVWVGHHELIAPPIWGPFLSSRIFLPVSYLPGAPQSLLQVLVDLCNLSSKILEQLRLSNWHYISIIWEGSEHNKAGKTKADASPSSSSVTTSCGNVGSCFTFLCPSSPSLKRMTTLLARLQS